MIKKIKFDFLIPKWPAPTSIKAVSTKKGYGYSKNSWEGFNFSLNVGDKKSDVIANREFLKNYFNLDEDPFVLIQQHGNKICELPVMNEVKADASTTTLPYKVCAVLTADCLPILLTNTKGDRVAAVHAGWRGLLSGIIESSIKKFDKNDSIIAWLGPAIGPQAFEVGDEVKDIFLKKIKKSENSFVKFRENTWYADIYSLAHLILNNFGVDKIYGGEYCTYSDSKNFYSYRRDSTTGRMASLIWIENKNQK
tara:strand:- start:43 stop:798 length:756 start_codon:yes stop_codon:yes gene_type:complete